MDDRRSYGDECRQLGVLFHEQKQFDKAAEWYQRARDIFEELGDVNRLARAYGQLGMVAEAQGNLDEALEWVARAYRLLDEEGIISTQHGRGTYILGPATARDTRRLRQKELAQLTEYFVQEAEKLGFTPKEVRAIIDDQVAAWDAELKTKLKGNS